MHAPTVRPATPFRGGYAGDVKRITAMMVAPVLVRLPLSTVSMGGPVAAAPLVRGDTSDFSFESFDADYTLARDAAGLAEMRVVETLVAVFPDYDQNRGILRDIPSYYGEVPLYLSDFAVHDENGNPVYFTQTNVDTSYDGSNAYEFRAVELALGTDEFVRGRTTYVISYTAHNVIRAFDQDHRDELYWDINGTEWAQSFGRVSVAVHVDESLRSALTGESACYTGYYGDTEPCNILESSAGEFTATVRDVGAWQNLTIAIGFEAGTFVQPELAQDSWIFTKAPLWLLLATLVLLGVAVLVRYGLWRDARGRGIIVPQYTVPDDRDLMKAGDLVNRESTAMAAQFVDLAVHGTVQIVDLYPYGADAGLNDRFGLDFVTKAGATAAELRVLNILFDELDEPGESVLLAALPAAVGASLYSQRAKAFDAVIADGMRAQPAGSLNRWLRRLGWLFGLGFAAIFIWTFFVQLDAGPVFGYAITSIVIFFIASGFLVKPYVLAETGAQARDYLLGIRDYLKLAEEDRLRVLQSPKGAERVVTTDKRSIVKLHEKLLPYAVLWGVEKEWSRELELEYQAVSDSPSWLNSDLSRVNLGNTLSSFSTRSGSSIRPIVTSSSSSGSSWSSGGSSSFSSGSSGGGSSGGGGGGGGGGGR